MGEWKTYRLGEIASVQTGPFGSQLHNEDYVADGTPIVTVEHLGLKNFTTQNLPCVSEEDTKRLSKYSMTKGDIIFSRVGSVDRCSYASEQHKGWLFSGRCLRVRASENIDSEYLYYFFCQETIKQFVRNIAVGATMPSINTKLLGEVPISLPPLPLQRRIASVLSSLDAKIETNRRINARLEEMAQALFRSWFIDYEPFKDGEFVEDDFGGRPKGWEVVKLGDVVENIGGYSYKGDELVDSSTAMATIKNFERNGGFKTDGYKEITVSSKCKPDQHAQLFDVLVAHTDLTQNADIIGNPALVLSKGKYTDLIFSMDLTKVVSKDKRLSNVILYNILKSPSFKGHALGYVNGTTVLHMSKKAVPEYETYLPQDLNVLAPLTLQLKPIYAEIANRMEQNISLSTLRDTLLPKLMSGELTPEEVTL